MSEGLCEMCGERPAEINITDVSDGTTTSYHLCAECARKMGVDEEGGSSLFSVSKLVAGMSKPLEGELVSPPEPIVCPFCGMNYGEFKDSGKLGCPQCYELFGEELSVLIRRLHGSFRHTGRGPGERTVEQAVQLELATLRKQLADAVSREAYEDAAHIRDRITALKRDG